MVAAMDGLMMDVALLIRDIAERVELLFPDREIVSRTHDGVERSTYARGGRARAAARVVADASSASSPGDRVATLRLELAAATSSSTSRCRAWAPCCTR